MLRFIAVIAMLAGFVASAQAADLALPMKAPATPAYNWSGWYVGINGGGASGRQDPFNIITDRFDSLSTSISGGMVGGTIGLQFALGNMLLGVEGDVDWARITGSTTATPTVGGVPIVPVTAQTDIDNQGTLRLRAGVPVGNWLPYATAGVAFLGAHTSLTGPGGVAACGGIFSACSGTNHQIGVAFGGGVEYGFTPNWSVKLEYLQVTAASLEISHDNEIRAGLNYRFGIGM
jgi:outer membrane immunogenic protein